jgi:imidazolonepropionase-like amidohydrolase
MTNKNALLRVSASLPPVNSSRRKSGNGAKSEAVFLLGSIWLMIMLFSPATLFASDLSIEHVTVVTADRPSPLKDAFVHVHEGRIVSVQTARGKSPKHSDGATVIDGSGLFLSPGLIDSHVHLGAIPGMTAEQEVAHPQIAAAARRQIPHGYLLSGFTTLIDLISTPDRMTEWQRSSDAVPDTYFCGGATVLDGYPMNYENQSARHQRWPYFLLEAGTPAPPGIDPAQHTPQAVVAHMKRDGARCVKTFFDRGFDPTKPLPVPTLATMRELVKAAHAAGLPVLIHANSDEGHRFALDAGVDIVAHGIWNWSEQNTSDLKITPGIQQLLDRELSTHVGYQPSLQVLAGIRDMFDPSFLSDPRLARVLPASLIDWYRSPEGGWFRDSVAQGVGLKTDTDPAELERVIDGRINTEVERGNATASYQIAHHGRILFGTDTPSSSSYANPPGLNAHLEMQTLVRLGETPAQLFRSATLTNAQALKLDRDVGTIQPGKRANLLLLRQDPTETVIAYDTVVMVILNGRVLNSSELAADNAH